MLQCQLYGEQYIIGVRRKDTSGTIGKKENLFIQTVK
jgi:hypothetical protein